MKPISEDLRQRIVAVYEDGQLSYSQVAERFRVSVRSVIRVVKQFRETGNVSPKPPSNGSQPILDDADIQYLKDTLDSQSDVTQDELKEGLKTATGTQVSQPTICRTLVRERLTRKKKRNEPANKNGRTSTLLVKPLARR